MTTQTSPKAEACCLSSDAAPEAQPQPTDRKPFVPPQLTDGGNLTLVTAGSITKKMWEGG